MRSVIGLLISLMLVSVSIAAMTPSTPASVVPTPTDLPADRIITPGDALPDAQLIHPFHPWRPRRDDIIGEVSQAGDTYYDYQSNGAIGKFIAVDPSGVVHVSWMDAYDVDSRDRFQVYRYLEEGEWYQDDGVEFDGTEDRSGYGCLTLSEEEEPRIIIFTHCMGGNYGDDMVWVAGIDFMPGFAAFTPTILPTFPNVGVCWPQGVMSPEGQIHIIGNDNGEDAEGRLAYLPAYINREGDVATDVDFPAELGETHLNTYRIARSPVSARAAVIWNNSRVGNPAPGPWDGFLAYQMNNDLWLAYTDDGEEWNFDDPVNVTNCIEPDAQREGNSVYGDTLLPYATFDVIFDSDDNIHIVFETRGLWWDPIGNEAPPVRRGGGLDRPGLTVDASILYHWDEVSEDITPVADGWFYQRQVIDDTIRALPTPGAWRSNVCYPSLAYDGDGNLYCVYNYYPENDHNDYVGTYGRCHGDIAVTVSDAEDNGSAWYQPTMVVQTRTHLPDPCEADCESYPTIAEMIDDHLHIFYINDREGGTIIQNDENAANTLNPCIYLKVPVEDILREEIWEDGPPFHMQFRPLVLDGVRDPAIPTPDNDIHVRATVTPDADNELRDVILLYRINEGEEQEVEMENVEGDIYAGTIPGQDEGTSVWYRIRATNDIGVTGFGPSSIYYWSFVVRNEGELTIQDIQALPNQDWGIDFSPYKGYNVTTQGVVTTPATFNQQYGGYAIQNGDGDWSGLIVRGIEDELSLGDLIEVTGIVMESDPDDPDKWEYATYIMVDEYSVIENGNPIEPESIELADLTWENRSEQLESVYIQVIDFEVSDPADDEFDELEKGYFPIENNSGDSWFATIGLIEMVIKDRELVYDIDNGIVQGTRFEMMSGVYTENWGHYAITPTREADIGEETIEEDGFMTPSRFSLEQPYPNPFNATTNIGFSLQKNNHVKLALYDLRGREIVTIVDGNMNAGQYSYVVDASELAAGVYILRLNADTETASCKLLLLK
ncbi:MAG: T9SS type A sorting domain-containing protein [Candidatus Hatepunaea meridiana]|nr:T9SS type A sorting domain-containing protein [Candidatus Hatepunaea meridiana]